MNGRDRPTALVVGSDHPDLVAFVDEVRAAGRPVAVAGGFEAPVSAPAPGFFAAACAAVATPPDRCLYVDGADRAVRGARAAGLSAFRYTGPDDLPYLRLALGL